MTAAGEYSALDRERAETYLRLQAEVQLRRALAMPEYKPPREHRASGSFYRPAQAHRMRRRRVAVARLVQQQARAQAQPAHKGLREPANQLERQARSLLAGLQQTATSSLAAARSAAGPLARQLRRTASHSEDWLAQIRHSAWHLRRRLRRQLPRRLRHRGYEPPPAQACAERVSELAAILAAVGAITEQTEADVVADLAFALAARGRIEPEAVLGAGRFPGHWRRGHASAHSAPSGPPRAHPVGAFATGEVEGVPIRFYLGVLVFDRGEVTLTMQARFPAESIKRDRRDVHTLFEALSEARAVDDRGGTYQAHFSGGGGDGKWDGRLHLMPAPPVGVRWLDMTLPGAPVVRVPTDTPPADLRVTTQPVTTTAANRLVDAQTAHLMLASTSEAQALLTDEDTYGSFGIAADLLGAGVLTTNSESLRRLAGAAARFGVPLPVPLAAIEPASLPASWLSLRARVDREEGPTGIIAVAAVLPQVDGTQCVIGELVSDADSATMQVHARGWPESRHHGGLRVDRFDWTARDDLGGWYLLGYGGWSSSDGDADLDLQFTPALDPRARALDITLTGPTTQVTVTVPLDWQEVA